MDFNNILPIIQGFAGGIIVAVSMWRINKYQIERLEKDYNGLGDILRRELKEIKETTVLKDMCTAIRTECKAKLEIQNDIHAEVRADIREIKLDIKGISESLTRHLGQHNGNL